MSKENKRRWPPTWAGMKNYIVELEDRIKELEQASVDDDIKNDDLAVIVKKQAEHIEKLTAENRWLTEEQNELISKLNKTMKRGLWSRLWNEEVC